MLKIRLKRVGRKHDPSFRLVVVESQRGPKSGDYIEHIGSYNARTDQKTVNKERALYWMSVGAQVSDTAHNLLIDTGVIEGKKINVLPKKSPIKKEGDEAEASAPSAAPVEVEASAEAVEAAEAPVE